MDRCRVTPSARCMFAALLALATAPLQARAQPPEAPRVGGPGDAAELEAFLDGVMTAHLRDHDIAGAVVSVVRDGAVFFAKGYGYADIAEQVPVDPERTLFRIGSVTKLFTWTAVMQLVEQRRLDLDADVNGYLDFRIPATFPQPITLTHLLTHTPGFEDRAAGLFADDSSAIVPAGQWLAAHIPARVRPPGTFISYSNYGTALAGYIVERVAGMPWEQYVEERILAPLGMEYATGRQPLPAALAPHMSEGYEFAHGRFEPKPPEIIPGAAAAGSMSASGLAMARFMIAHLQDGRLGDARVLQAETARRMRTRLFTHDPRINGYAYGFYEMDSHGQRIVGHGGDTRWFHTDLALFPEHGLGVFVSYNTQEGGELSFREFLQTFLDHYFARPRASAPEPPEGFAERAGRFTGSYRFNRSSYTTFEKVAGLGASVTVSATREGELLLKSPLGESRLVEVGPFLFQDAHENETVAFREDGGGHVTHMFLNSVPVLALEKLPWWGAPRIHLVVLGTSVVVFLVVAVRGIVRLFRRRAGAAPEPREARAARGVATAVAAVNVLFVIGLAIFAANAEEIVLRGSLASLRLLLALPVISALLTAGAASCAVLAWRKKLWTVWARLRYSALAALALVFVLVVNYWNLLGWRF